MGFWRGDTVFQDHGHLVEAHLHHDLVRRQRQVVTWTPGTAPGSPGTNYTVGNGTETATYTRQGDWVNASYLLQFGSTTALTTAATHTPLPFPADVNSHPVVSTWARKSGGGALTYDLTGGGLLVDLDADGNGVRIRPYVQMQSGSERVELRQGTSQNLVNGVVAFLAWDTEVSDTDNMWSSGDPTNVYVRTPGQYIVTGFAGLPQGQVYTHAQLGCILNGAQWLFLSEDNTQTGSHSTDKWLNGSWAGFLGTGSRLQLRMLQNNDAAATVPSSNAGSAVPKFTLMRIGPNGLSSIVAVAEPWLWADGYSLRVSTFYKVASGY